MWADSGTVTRDVVIIEYPNTQARCMHMLGDHHAFNKSWASDVWLWWSAYRFTYRLLPWCLVTRGKKCPRSIISFLSLTETHLHFYIFVISYSMIKIKKKAWMKKIKWGKRDLISCAFLTHFVYQEWVGEEKNNWCILLFK